MPGYAAKRVKRAAPFILIAGAVFFIALPFFNAEGSSIKGTHIGSLDIGQIKYEEVEIQLAQYLKQFKNTKIIIETQDGTQISASPSSMGIEFKTDLTLAAAAVLGRNGSSVKKIYEQTRALLFGTTIPMQFVFNEERFDNFTSSTLASIHRPATSASFMYNPRIDDFDFAPAQEGLIIDISALKKEIAGAIENLSADIILVEQYFQQPLVISQGVDAALLKAQQILETMPYVISSQDEQWDVERDDLIFWIEFKPEFNNERNQYYLAATLSQNKIEDYLTRFAPGLNAMASNAEFIISDNVVREFKLSQPGFELDVKISAATIKNNFENTENTAELTFKIIHPAITSENINNLGINALLARGETDFAGSPESRKHNITIGSNKYQGVLIAPREEFSFNELLGAVTAREGYLPELVIKKNKTVPEYGGGLCQVSTTLFRAAVNAGLEITQRYNHSYPVRYYGTPGFDATIYPPNPDLAFINNTSGTILLQHKIEGTKLIFEIYGTDEGRTVEIEGPYTYDVRTDGSMKAWLKQTVRDDSGDVILEKTFYSNYKSPDNYPIDRNPLE